MSDLLPVIIGLWVVSAWLTHVIFSIKTASWFLLLAGAIVFPVGCVHGTGLWFGWF